MDLQLATEYTCGFDDKELHQPSDELFQAPFLAIGIFVLWLWSEAWLKLAKSKPELVKFEAFANFWTPMYMGFIALTYTACKGMLVEILIPTGFMDIDKVEHYVKGIVATDQLYCNTTEHDVNATLEWATEAKLGNVTSWFAILSPVWTVLTLIVCGYHTYTHIAKIHANNKVMEGLDDAGKKQCDSANEDHRTIIWILALPMFYGLMSLKSVIRMQQVVLNHVGQSSQHLYRNFGERQYFLTQMYEVNNYVGDLYETVGLVYFARLLLKMLRRAADHKKYSVDNQKHREAVTDKLLYSLSEVSMVGIKSFYYVCLIQAIFYLFGCQMAYWAAYPEYFNPDQDHPGLFYSESFYNKMYYLDYGAGLVSSFVAIYDLIALEHTFEHLYDDVMFERVPIKFWATKILVSLAFIQSMIKSALPTTEVRANLIFAAILTIECMLIALGHMLAWNPNEHWYQDWKPALGAREKNAAAKPLLA